MYANKCIHTPVLFELSFSYIRLFYLRRSRCYTTKINSRFFILNKKYNVFIITTIQGD